MRPRPGADVQPSRKLFAATCRSSEPEDASMFADPAATPQTGSPAASRMWHNRMIDCRASEGSYPHRAALCRTGFGTSSLPLAVLGDFRVSANGAVISLNPCPP
jgi:hypothetical protein